MNNYDLNSAAASAPATKREELARSIEGEFSSDEKLDKAKKKLKKYRKLYKSAKSHKKGNRKKYKKYKKKVRKLELRLIEQEYQMKVLSMKAECESRMYQILYQLSSGRQIPKFDTYPGLPQFTERDDK